MVLRNVRILHRYMASQFRDRDSDFYRRENRGIMGDLRYKLHFSNSVLNQYDLVTKLAQ